MKSTEVRRARALVAAIGLIVAVLAYSDARNPVAGQATAQAAQEASRERPSQAHEVEAALARTGLAAKLEVALGGAFGGVWFDPAAAQVHVGVTSPLARRNAEAVAAQAGLAEDVVATPVRSSWEQLLAAQARWSHRLEDLLERGWASTSLATDLNSLEVELSSSVPPTRREALERAAATASVGIEIRVAPSADLTGVKAARCAKFAKFKAFCDPTIVAGMSLDGPVPEKGQPRKTCTAGPTAIEKGATEKAAATVTYLLTAGHCIVGAGGSGLGWFAYSKKGEPEGEHEVGTAGVYLNGESDIGIITMDQAFWARANNLIPVIPALAEWSAAAEVEPTAVKSQANPTKNTKTCFSGERSGKVCGEIIETGVSKKFEGETEFTKNLAKVQLAGGKKGGIGDSGGPFYSETSTSTVEGTLVGIDEEGKTEEGNIIYFQPLNISFEKLEKEKETALELLTEAKEKRHPKLKAGKFPVTIHGTGHSEKFTTEAGTIECKSTTYHAVASEESSTLTIAPEYKECKASFLEASATVSMEGCAYVFHVIEKTSTDNYRAESDISCPEGKSIKITAATCSAEIKAQTGRETVDLIDDTEASPKRDITMRPTLTGIAYSVTNDGSLCPFSGTGEKTGGEYTSGENTTLTGQSTTEGAEKIAIEIVDQ
ncbi:MAG TPA: hypothetical protein VHQ43_04545 [Solirubrobacterales bacterium]|jgi:hypothetical protein|nr:hypothetical protein [Solirubrobacterales bacterium]